MKVPQIAERAFYVKVLAGEECQCDRPKNRGKAFCYRCFRELPTAMQRALYRPLGLGFEQAYEEAVKWLQTNVCDAHDGSERLRRHRES